MADLPRGRGIFRGRGRGRGGGRGGHRRETNEDHRDVPWKILLGFRRLQELKEKEPNEIALTLSQRKTAFKEALNENQHDETMVGLFLRCLSKVCQCQSLRESIIELFVILEDSKFFKCSLPAYLFSVSESVLESSHDRQLTFQQPLRDVIVIVKEFRLRMPQSILSIMGLNSILDTTFKALREKSSIIIDDEMWDDYVEYKESQESALKRIKHKVQ